MVTNQWQPVRLGYLFVDGATPQTVNFLNHHWIGSYKAGSMTCMLASSAVKVGHRLPELRTTCRDVAMKALMAMDEHLMTFVIDPTAGLSSPEAGPVQRKMFDGRAPTCWLRAYWQGRELGWWA